MDTGNVDETYATDQEGRTALLVQSQAQFLRFLVRHLGNCAEAEDLLQTAYLKALTASATVRDDEKVLAWFYRVLRNVLVDAQRHRAATERLEARLIREPPAATMPDEALFHTVCQCVLDIAHALKPEYRDILQRVELEEASLTEAAVALGITPNHASVRLHRARQALRTALIHMCGTCAEHGCLDCTCRRPASPSPSA
jgi:RNA polymerase sigma-70 factor (ECF subfamily)